MSQKQPVGERSHFGSSSKTGPSASLGKTSTNSSRCHSTATMRAGKYHRLNSEAPAQGETNRAATVSWAWVPSPSPSCDVRRAAEHRPSPRGPLRRRRRTDSSALAQETQGNRGALALHENSRQSTRTATAPAGDERKRETTLYFASAPLPLRRPACGLGTRSTGPALPVLATVFAA